MVYLQSLDFAQLESKGHWTLPVSRLHNQDREKVICSKLPASDEAGDKSARLFFSPDPISRTMLSSPRKVSQVYVPKSCINLPEWLVGPAGSTPRSNGHGQGLGSSQFPGQFCTQCPSWWNKTQRWLEEAAVCGAGTLAPRTHKAWRLALWLSMALGSPS